MQKRRSFPGSPTCRFFEWFFSLNDGIAFVIFEVPPKKIMFLFQKDYYSHMLRGTGVFTLPLASMGNVGKYSFHVAFEIVLVRVSFLRFSQGRLEKMKHIPQILLKFLFTVVESAKKSP